MRSKSPKGCRVFLSILIGVSLLGCSSERSSSSQSKPPAVDLAPEKERPKPERAVPSIASVRAAFESGQLEKAGRLAQSLLIAKPEHAEALYFLANVQHRSGSVDEAIETLLQISGSDPQFGLMALGQAADWQLGEGDVKEAEATLKKLLLIKDMPLANSRLATLLNSQGRRFEAAKHLQKLAELQDITRRELGGLISISDQCSVQKVPGTTGTDENPVEGDLRRARQLSASGQWEQSLQLLRNLRTRFPESPSIAAFMGRALVTLQDLDGLVEWHRSLPATTADQPEYWNAMAGWLSLQGNHSAAIRCACESLSRDPTSGRMYESLSRSLTSQGDLLGADQARDRAQLIGELQRAYQAVALTEQPTAEGCAKIAVLLLKLNRPWEALGWQTSAAKIDPRNSHVVDLADAIQSYQPADSVASWVLCGLDPADFPLPETIDQTAGVRVAVGGSDAASSILLKDVAAELGLNFQYGKGKRPDDETYEIHEAMGGGIGVIDYDLDGWPDLYFSQASEQAFAEASESDSLYRNVEGSHFQLVSDVANVSAKHSGQGVTAADWNQDGFTDLIVAAIGPNSFYRNNGDGTFTRVAVPGLDDEDRWTSMIACGDLSGDSLPEFAECNYFSRKGVEQWCKVTDEKCGPLIYGAAGNRFVQLQSDGSFSEWESAASHGTPGYSLGVLIANLDGKAGNDLFVANDTTTNDLWISKVNDTSSKDQFVLNEEGLIRGCATGSVGELQGCMGIATGDFDGNGTMDLHVTNYFNEPSNLFLQQTAGIFVDCAAMSGARQATEKLVGFGTQANDLDRDGWLDLVVLNGHAIDRRRLGEPLAMTPQVFRGQSGKFATVKLDNSYFEQPAIGRTLARLDFDRDGKTDFVANHLDQPTALLRNETAGGGNWIRFQLVGTDSERDAVGAKVVIAAGERNWVSWTTSGEGYFSSNEAVVDFGVGATTMIDRIEVSWPSGETQTFHALDVGRRYLLVEGNSVTYGF